MATKKKAAKPAKKGKTSPKKPVANISVSIRQKEVNSGTG